MPLQFSNLGVGQKGWYKMLANGNHESCPSLVWCLQNILVFLILLWCVCTCQCSLIISYFNLDFLTLFIVYSVPIYLSFFLLPVLL